MGTSRMLPWDAFVYRKIKVISVTCVSLSEYTKTSKIQIVHCILMKNNASTRSTTFIKLVISDMISNINQLFFLQ